MRNNYFDQILSSFPIQEAYYVISFPSSLCLELYLEFFFSIGTMRPSTRNWIFDALLRPTPLAVRSVPMRTALETHAAQYLPLASSFALALSVGQPRSYTASSTMLACSSYQPARLPASFDFVSVRPRLRMSVVIGNILVHPLWICNWY